MHRVCVCVCVCVCYRTKAFSVTLQNTISHWALCVRNKVTLIELTFAGDLAERGSGKINLFRLNNCRPLATLYSSEKHF